MSTCVRKCTFARACNVGANSLNVVSRTFPHFSQSMLTPMTCARAFLTHWVAIFGVPATLTTDRSRQFVSELWKKTATLSGAYTDVTTAYHPEANGLVERTHRTMKASLKAKLGSDPNWCDTLLVVLLGMRAAVKQDINCSVAEMVYGEQLLLPGECFTTSAANWNTDPSCVVDLRQRMQQVRPVPQCGMAKSLAVRLCTRSFPLLHTCLSMFMQTSLRFKHPTDDRSRY